MKEIPIPIPTLNGIAMDSCTRCTLAWFSFLILALELSGNSSEVLPRIYWVYCMLYAEQYVGEYSYSYEQNELHPFLTFERINKQKTAMGKIAPQITTPETFLLGKTDLKKWLFIENFATFRWKDAKTEFAPIWLWITLLSIDNHNCDIRSCCCCCCCCLPWSLLRSDVVGLCETFSFQFVTIVH